MFPSLRTGDPKEIEFKWVKKKDGRLYESFTYDGLSYSLYDCVYLHNKSEPHIGKLIGIRENADKSKQIDVQWFLRPSEIVHYLGDAEVQKNELFLASGHGVGLSDINPLEALSGKCNVVCISTDSRNPQPSAKELIMASYVFSRTFDVEKLEISDQIGDKVGWIPVEYVFNREDSNKTPFIQNLDPNSKYDEKNEFEEIEKLSSKKTPEQSNTLDLDENCNDIIETQGTDSKQIRVKRTGKSVCVSNELEDTPSKRWKPNDIGTSSHGGCGNDVQSSPISGIDTTPLDVCALLVEGPKLGPLVDLNLAKKPSSSNEKLLDASPLVVCASPSNAQSKRVEGLKLGPLVDVNLAKKEKLPIASRLVICALLANLQLELVKGQRLGRTVDVNMAQKSSSSNKKLSKISASRPRENLESCCVGNGIENEGNSNKNLETLVEGLSEEISNPGKAKYVGTGKDVGGVENSSPCRGRSSIGNVDSPNERSSSSCKKDCNGPRQATKLAKDSSSLTRKVLKKVAHSRGNPNAKDDYGHENDDEILLNDLCPLEERSSKKEKCEDSKISRHDDKAKGKYLEKVGACKAKDLLIASCDEDDIRLTKDSCLVEERTRKKAKCGDSKISRRDDKVDGNMLKKGGAGKGNISLVTTDMAKSSSSKDTLDEGPSKECHDKKNKVVDRLSKLREGKRFEVTRRPPENRSKWLGELPWEENLKSAYGEQRVVLLLNLNPNYSSGDVEDIVWNAFKEYGTARILQRTSISSPRSAFFIFKNRKAATNVVEKLHTECLMLPNNRPLVACTEFNTQFSGLNQKKFVGHLFIDKVRRQEVMENKDVCTSHYAQDNTLEYDMAMEWILQYYRSDESWKRLYEQQGKELRKLLSDLKSKSR